MDFYSILEINNDASENDIKKAYRKLALIWHPDKNKDKEAEKKFMNISEAYQVLIDDNKRRIYDATGTYDDIHNAYDIFNNFFGKISNFIDNSPEIEILMTTLGYDNLTIFDKFVEKSKNINVSLGMKMNDINDRIKQKNTEIQTKLYNYKTPDLVFNLNVKLTEVYNNITKKIKIKRKKHDNRLNSYYDDDKYFLVPLFERKKIYELEGDMKRGYKISGDIIFNINIKSDKSPFEIINNGYDISVEKKISLYEVVFGTVFYMKNIDGKILKIKINDGIGKSMMKKIYNYGLPRKSTNDDRGDLIIKFIIVDDIEDNNENREIIRLLSKPYEEFFTGDNIFSTTNDIKEDIII
jgi:DnaJ homolog subfamily B member 4